MTTDSTTKPIVAVKRTQRDDALWPWQATLTEQVPDTTPIGPHAITRYGGTKRSAIGNLRRALERADNATDRQLWKQYKLHVLVALQEAIDEEVNNREKNKLLE